MDIDSLYSEVTIRHGLTARLRLEALRGSLVADLAGDHAPPTQRDTTILPSSPTVPSPRGRP